MALALVVVDYCDLSNVACSSSLAPPCQPMPAEQKCDQALSAEVAEPPIDRRISPASLRAA